MNRILLVDDHALVRSGLVRMLSNHFSSAVISEAANAEDAVSLLKAQVWDLLILDVGLPGRSGLEFLDDVRSIRPSLPVLLLSGLTDDVIAVRGFEKGASGYLCKDCSVEELVAAVHKLLCGGRYLSGELAEKLVANLAVASGRESPLTGHAEIRGRLFDVLLRLGHGEPVKMIAAEMGLSVKTVSTYRVRLLERLLLKSNVDIVRYCLLHGLVQ